MAFSIGTIKSFLKKDITKREEVSILGIDIGSSAIKVVQLRDNKGVPTLDTYGELQLGPYGGLDIGQTTQLDVKKLIEAFVDIIRESAATSKDISLALSFNSSFSTIIPVPTKEIEQIDTMIPVEARKYIPMALTEITLDWFPVSATQDKKTTKVLLVAIHNEALKKYSSIVKGANLNERFVEVEVFSTLRSTIEAQEGIVAIIDFGGGSTKLYIAERGIIGKSHSLRLSGAELTSTLAAGLNISFKDAEIFKRQNGVLLRQDSPDAQKAMITTLERGLRQVHMVMKRFCEEEQVGIEKVYLTGSGSLLPGLPKYAENMFSLPVTMSNPFAKVAYPAFLEDTLQEAGPTFAVAVGAALRGMPAK